MFLDLSKKGLIMDASKIETYLDLQEEIENSVDDIVKRYNEIWREVTGKPNQYYRIYGSFIELSGDDIHIGGDEYWSYGGYERHDDYIPTRYLYDPNWENEVRQDAEKQLSLEQRSERNKRLSELSDAKKTVDRIEKELSEKGLDISLNT